MTVAIGILMLLAFFGAWFYIEGKVNGWRMATEAFLMAIGASIFIIVAVFLIFL